MYCDLFSLARTFSLVNMWFIALEVVLNISETIFIDLAKITNRYHMKIVSGDLNVKEKRKRFQSDIWNWNQKSKLYQFQKPHCQKYNVSTS
jgi:hypothetical protein